MDTLNINQRRFVLFGVLIGGIWGGISLILTIFNKILFKKAVAGIEMGFLHDAFTFALAGVIFGLFFWGIFVVMARKLPFKRNIVKGMIVSMSLWAIFLFNGILLILARPERYHLNLYEVLQGGILFLILGLIMGIFKDRYYPEVEKF